ncbi:MAG: TonB-dependent receptor plug domain-containing protein [Desulfuromonadaceae bacterium]|nr:TonB-dependent receptor plug domain-containing protein [Desulfuromonadaceae bacterium]
MGSFSSPLVFRNIHQLRALVAVQQVLTISVLSTPSSNTSIAMMSPPDDFFSSALDGRFGKRLYTKSKIPARKKSSSSKTIKNQNEFNYLLPISTGICVRRNFYQKLIIVLLASMLCGALPVFADDELDTLGFTDAPEETLISTSRILRPTSKVAENVTVITAVDIVRLNAHTLAEVLQAVPGIQLDYLRTPSSFTFFNIQGALSNTTMVLIDGIRQNDFDQNGVWVGLIPVQQIDRVEIIKGAASATWGPALGGVINIITKTPNPERTVSGMVSGSIGSNFTADSRAELSGAKERLGYYLTAGNLRSDGLSPNTATNMNSLYGKLVYTLPGNGTVTLGLSHLAAKPGLDEGDTARWGFVHDNNEYRRNNGFIKFSQPLAAKLNLDLDVYITNRDDHTKLGGSDQDAIVFFNDLTVRESSRGANARLSWGDSERSLITGFEYAKAKATCTDLLSSDPPVYDRSWDSWSLYSNGTYSIDQLTILPGVRLDHTGLAGDNTSYTLGATYQLTETTTLRTYGAKGFTLPTPRSQTNTLQKIQTIQGGIESGAVPYVWLKGTYFYNILRDSESAGDIAITNQTRQGFEIEARTTPLFNVSLTGGYTYLYAKNSDTGERLQSNSQQTVPPHTVKFALNYDKADLGLRGVLTGNYAWLNATDGYPAANAGMVWDLHLNWKVKPKSGLSPELFFSGHNLFNGVQTTDTVLYENAKRWFEGGVRVNF